MLPARKIHFEAKNERKRELKIPKLLKMQMRNEKELDQQFYNCTKNYLKTSIAADAVTVVKSTVRNLRQMK